MHIVKKSHALLISLLAVLSGCSFSAAEIPADHFYRLPVAQAEAVATQLYDQILIRPIQVDGLYHERAILYVEQDTPLEIQRYRYHYWVEPPASLVNKYMSSWLQKSTVAANVTNIATVEPAQLEISARITAFERLVNKGTSESQLGMEFTLSYANGNTRSWTKEYRERVPCASFAMHDTAMAFGQALERIMQALLNDLQQK